MIRDSNALDHTHRVVVIEDDADLREAMLGVVAAQGWNAVGADDGADALKKIKTGPAPCIIFLDLMMPHMDGWQFLSELRLNPAFARTPVVVVTGYGSPQGARSLGAADVLKKPFDPAQMVALVERHCTADAP